MFWLSFANADSVPAEVADCGRAMGLPGLEHLELPDQVARVRQVWQEPIPRLLVFDNCEDEQLLAAWRPATGGCRVLATSRRGRWDPGLGVASLALNVLERPESMVLLRRFTPGLSEEEAGAIAAELGDFPLALSLAGSFLARYGRVVSPAEYLAQLRNGALLAHPSLQGRGGRLSHTGHERHVARTFALSYERLDPEDKTDRLARALLARAAHFAAGEPIPQDLLLAALERDGEGGEPQAMLLQATDALIRLVELGLVEGEEGGAVRLHRLLAEFVRGAVADEGAQTAVERAILAALSERIDLAGYLRGMSPLEPHLRAATEAAGGREDEQAAYLCAWLGYYLRGIGLYPAARPYLERALAIREKALGPEHPRTATTLNNLGSLLREQGKYAEARPYLERALAIREKVWGPEHPETSSSLNNLGLLWQAQGDYAGARPYLERALAIREKALGPDHPHTATVLSNLGSLLQAQGEYAAARPYFERALAINEKTLGPEHRRTAQSLSHLGKLLASSGERAGARPYLERALAILERVLGPEHPHTATALNNLGNWLREQGKYAEARPYLERALAIYEKVLGPEHPQTEVMRENLAALVEGDPPGG
ncbi:MAG: tetratricopeptide repeat protein [Chloroflexi bacterium]|nr:tetratricopeptide repeat protein [Chloroflexota bacterium]MCI0646563.1 tetratricopeptide repeat protein [Chloroflexota bacterium]MCI0726365.1 tetratricopeptide repeat protein [Chloroflexota bacterium]